MPARDSSGLFLVSACLCGVPCRYDGGRSTHPFLMDLFLRGFAVPVCPETLGGLSIPRPPAEIANGRVVDRQGRDVTAAFVLGAAETLKIARNRGITAAVLKERSPSCGVSRIYDGTFSARVIPGSGITATVLRAAGFDLYTGEDFEKAPFFAPERFTA